jgi:hypothetical protein
VCRSVTASLGPQAHLSYMTQGQMRVVHAQRVGSDLPARALFFTFGLGT